MEVLERVSCGNLSLLLRFLRFIGKLEHHVAVAALLVYLGCDVKHGYSCPQKMRSDGSLGAGDVRKSSPLR